MKSHVITFSQLHIDHTVNRTVFFRSHINNVTIGPRNRRYNINRKGGHELVKKSRLG